MRCRRAISGFAACCEPAGGVLASHHS